MYSSPEVVDTTFTLLTLLNVLAEEFVVFLRVVFILQFIQIKVRDSSKEDNQHTFDVKYLREPWLSP